MDENASDACNARWVRLVDESAYRLHVGLAPFVTVEEPLPLRSRTIEDSSPASSGSGRTTTSSSSSVHTPPSPTTRKLPSFAVGAKRHDELEFTVDLLLHDCTRAGEPATGELCERVLNGARIVQPRDDRARFRLVEDGRISGLEHHRVGDAVSAAATSSASVSSTAVAVLMPYAESAARAGIPELASSAVRRGRHRHPIRDAAAVPGPLSGAARLQLPYRGPSGRRVMPPRIGIPSEASALRGGVEVAGQR